MAVTVWITAASIASAGASLPPLVEMECSAIVQPQGGATTVVNDEALKVLEQTSGSGEFAYDREDTRAILCERNDLVPAVSDLKVLNAGYPLYITVVFGPDARIGALEVSGGRLRFRMMQGELTAYEKQRLQDRLNEIQEAARNG